MGHDLTDIEHDMANVVHMANSRNLNMTNNTYQFDAPSARVLAKKETSVLRKIVPLLAGPVTAAALGLILHQNPLVAKKFFQVVGQSAKMLSPAARAKIVGLLQKISKGVREFGKGVRYPATGAGGRTWYGAWAQPSRATSAGARVGRAVGAAMHAAGKVHNTVGSIRSKIPSTYNVANFVQGMGNTNNAPAGWFQRTEKKSRARARGAKVSFAVRHAMGLA